MKYSRMFFQIVKDSLVKQNLGVWRVTLGLDEILKCPNELVIPFIYKSIHLFESNSSHTNIIFNQSQIELSTRGPLNKFIPQTIYSTVHLYIWKKKFQQFIQLFIHSLKQISFRPYIGGSNHIYIRIFLFSPIHSFIHF